ncbi:transporter substrate-binding domain-containing protein [Allochromatium vinosum]|uniref:transporter substrate-binding domain-containing protein n=1 Tax=Allochromatium vinosum TaxID=1049 RepID=UPI00190849F6|nr:transporter substrate-binding domain-containing protein [Allochromatium vinosum]MBK1653293.1 ABC transporter substrate-binding protein [Allochromatium vinosum]
MSIRLWTLILAPLALAGAAILLFSLGPEPDDTLARVRTEGVIRIGYAVEPPYAFVTPGGEVTGESPEVAKILVARLGIERIVWSQMAFSELIPALQTGRIDVIAAGLFVNAERARQVRFSRPTFRVRPALLVAKGNPYALRACEDLLGQPELRVAVIAGSVEQALLHRVGLADERLVPVPDALTGSRAVESGLADVLALSSPTLRWRLEQAPLADVELVQVPDEPTTLAGADYGIGAFAFRLIDQRLAQAWDEAARDYIGGAEHRALLKRFGFGPTEVPQPVAHGVTHD